MRAEFENWYCAECWNFKDPFPNLWNGSRYDQLNVQLAWRSWQMASVGLRIAAVAAKDALESIEVDYRSASGYPLEVSFSEDKQKYALTLLDKALNGETDDVHAS